MNYIENIDPILRGVRDIVLPFYGNVSFKNKSGRTLEVVTELDTKVEQYLREELKKKYSDIGFVGEEEGGDRDAKSFWLVDPIDGTACFIRGLPFCTTMIARIDNGRAVFGGIYDFVRDILYFAEEGKGAFMNGEQIHVSSRPLHGAFLSFETDLKKPANLTLFSQVFQNSTILKIPTAGFELAMVARGAIDGRICLDPFGKDYDYAPGTLLVKEAGGVVANMGTHTYDYKNTNFIAANPEVFQALTGGDGALFPISG